MQKMAQQFWNRWSHEYLTRIQKRPKWRTKNNDVKVNDLELIHEDNLPIVRWRLGRVIAIHPARDGVTRVNILSTVNGETSRPIVKISRLPLDSDSQ